MKKELDFCYKGSRDYIHGTDIYNELLKLFDIKSVDLTFHGIAKRNITLLEIQPANMSTLKFAFRYVDINNTKHTLYGVTNSTEVSCSYDYNEESICLNSKLDIKNEKISLINHTNYSFIEECVTLNKYLLENLFPQLNGKWYFTRVQLNKQIVYNSFNLELTLKANFNFKLTKSEIKIDDTIVGYIYFSMKD